MTETGLPRSALLAVAGVAAAGLTLGAAAWGQGGSQVQYQIVVGDTVTVAPGVNTSVSLTIAARPGYTISRDGPLAVELEASAGLALPKTSYRRGDAADTRADNPRFDLRFRAVTEGSHQLEVAVRFWVCTRRTCRPANEQRTVTVTAVAPSGPADAGISDAG